MNEVVEFASKFSLCIYIKKKSSTIGSYVAFYFVEKQVDACME